MSDLENLKERDDDDIPIIPESARPANPYMNLDKWIEETNRILDKKADGVPVDYAAILAQEREKDDEYTKP